MGRGVGIILVPFHNSSRIYASAPCPNTHVYSSDKRCPARVGSPRNPLLGSPCPTRILFHFKRRHSCFFSVADCTTDSFDSSSQALPHKNQVGKRLLPDHFGARN